MQDDGDDRKQQQKVNQKAGGLEQNKGTDPYDEENNGKREKHCGTFLWGLDYASPHSLSKRRLGADPLPTDVGVRNLRKR